MSSTNASPETTNKIWRSKKRPLFSDIPDNVTGDERELLIRRIWRNGKRVLLRVWPASE